MVSLSKIIIHDMTLVKGTQCEKIRLKAPKMGVELVILR